jgi:L-asparaginase
MKTQPVLIVHGGAASRIAGPRLASTFADSLQSILAEVSRELSRGASATQCVVEAVRRLEDDPLYNAGRGSKLQSDGKIRMSAALMDGHLRRFSGCVNVEGLKNPILLAKALATKRDRVLACEGAERFAREAGLDFASNYTDERVREHERKKSGKSGTVGALALDCKGRLAAATSTGGRGHEYPYRVSDSPTSAGNYANRFCAVSATGTGEEIVEHAVAARICTLVESGISISRAVKAVLGPAGRAGCDFGMIALDARGKFVAATTTASLVWAVAQGGKISALGREKKY